MTAGPSCTGILVSINITLSSTAGCRDWQWNLTLFFRFRQASQPRLDGTPGIWIRVYSEYRLWPCNSHVQSQNVNRFVNAVLSARLGYSTPMGFYPPQVNGPSWSVGKKRNQSSLDVHTITNISRRQGHFVLVSTTCCAWRPARAKKGIPTSISRHTLASPVDQTVEKMPNVILGSVLSYRAVAFGTASLPGTILVLVWLYLNTASNARRAFSGSGKNPSLREIQASRRRGLGGLGLEGPGCQSRRPSYFAHLYSASASGNTLRPPPVGAAEISPRCKWDNHQPLSSRAAPFPK